jgi:hypothetical protein
MGQYGCVRFNFNRFHAIRAGEKRQSLCRVNVPRLIPDLKCWMVIEDTRKWSSDLYSLRRLVVGLLILAICGASMPSAVAMGLRHASDTRLPSPPELYVTDHVDGMALAGITLFWKVTCGGEFAGSRSYLKRIGSNHVVGDSQPLTSMYGPAACQPDRVASANLAIDIADVYYITGDGSVARISRYVGGTTSPTILTTGAVTHNISGFPSCCSIAVDNTYVYWNDGNIVYRAGKSGGPRQQIYVATRAVRDLRVYGNADLYLLAGNTLIQLQPNAGAYRATHVAENASAFALDGARVYWSSIVGSSFAIKSALASDLTSQHLLALGHGVRAPGIDNMAVDAANLYWHSTVNVSGGPIYRLSLSAAPGSAPDAISTYLLMGSPLLTDGLHLFWTDYNTGIYRLGTGAGITGPPGNVIITGIEATQSIQTTDNRIPLIAYKRTAIRVYEQSHEDSGGPWSGVTARLTVDGSPISHVPSISYTTTVLPTGSDRTSLDHSFVFELDPAETAPGTRSIHVQLVPPPGRPITVTPDSTRTMALAFGPSSPVMNFGFYGVRYSYRNPTTAALPFSDLVQEAQFTSALFPTSQVYAMHLPGDPTAAFDYRDGAGYLDARAWGASLIDHAFPEGNQRIDILQPEHQEGGYYGADFTSGAGNFVINEQYLIPDPGPVMAHELGHSWLGSAHVISPEHGAYPPPFSDFPYTHASIGPQVGVDIQPGPTGASISLLSGTPPGDHTHDFMSYAHPAWASPYTYCKLIHMISQDHLNCSAGASVAQLITVPRFRQLGAAAPITHAAPLHAQSSRAAQPADAQHTRTYLYVLGRFNRDGTASFYPFDQATTQQNLASKLKGNTYSLQLVDSHGKVLSTAGFNAPAGSGHPKYLGPDVFSMWVPFNNRTSRIVLRRGNKVIVQRSVSAHKPVVRLLTPRGGGTLSGHQTIKWVASDADNNPLTYIVEYSRDAGKTWTPLNVGLTGTSLAVDFATLPGSNRGLIRVLATDGVNTVEARSQAFEVPFQAATITLLAPRNGATFQQYQPVDGQGYAISWGDRPISAIKQYSWTSDRDGFLGIGPWLSRTLSPGRHKLTLTVVDNAGRRSSTSVHIVVLGGRPAAQSSPTATATYPPKSTATSTPKVTATSTPTTSAQVTSATPTATGAATSTATATPTSTETVKQQSTCTTGGQPTDTFDNGYGAAWKQSLPSKSIYFVPAGPGCLRLVVPNDAVYDAWTNADNAPELLRSDMGTGSWTATTRLTVSGSSATGGGYHTGLLVRFAPAANSSSPPSQIFWGLYQPSPSSLVGLLLEQTGTHGLATIGNAPNTVALRTTFKTDGQKLCQYSFAFKADGDANFTDTGKQIDTCQPVAGVGIFTKTFNGAPRSVITDFDWFDLTTP